MARIEEIERRLQNWARWRAGLRTGGLHYARVDFEAAMGGRDGYREAAIPTNDCEADETERAVGSLQSELRRTVEVVYLDQHLSAKHQAAKLCIAEATVKARVWHAHRLIQGWITDRHQRARQERERVERLRASAVKGGRG